VVLSDGTKPRERCRNRLFKHRGDGTFVDGTFTDITRPAGVGGSSCSVGAVWLDYDNNGLVGTGKQPTARLRFATTIAHNYTWQVDFQGDAVWVATAQGVSRGVPRPR